MKLISILVFLFQVSFGFSASYSIRLAVKSGTLDFNNGTSLAYKVFTSQAAFSNKSDLLVFQTGDVVTLKVVNEDTESHAFVIDGIADFGTILPGDSVEQILNPITEGIFRYYDPLNSPYNEYLGLSGIIHVKAITDLVPYFYWDVREHQETWNSDIILGNSPTLNLYYPNYFTINGNSDPDINSDITARAIGTVNNEIRIVIVNNGLSIHSMHLHGYHGLLLKNSKNGLHEGRSKDTFPVYPKEFVILSITPDKPGEYPVHDHNLITVTGGGIYHAGIFTTILIAP